MQGFVSTEYAMLKLFVIATFLISALVGRLTIPKIILIAKKKKLFDEFSERKLHHTNIPRLGGVAFFPAFLFSVSLMMGLRYYLGYDITSLRNHIHMLIYL